MQLNLRTWGTGPRTAVLVHGFSDDSGTWWRLGPAVAELGFTVLAPDLRGHGGSPRAEDYGLDLFAQDLVDSLPTGVDLLLGHSLGAMVVALAAERLQPERAVFVDPSWMRPRGEVDLTRQLPTHAAQLPAETRAWSPEDVAAELSSNANLDPGVALSLMGHLAPGDSVPPPVAPVTGAAVLVPETDAALPLTAHPQLVSLGYRIRSLAGVGHVMHRDDFDGFLALLLPELLGDLAA